MSKSINAIELAEIVTKLLTGNSGELESHESFAAFMTGIASQICDHCGGEVHYSAEMAEGSDGQSKDWYVGIHGNDSLPSAFGGIWREYDPEGELFADHLVRIKDEIALIADRAFEAYDFGQGVTVTDHSGWEYVNAGEERSRKVYVETNREDDGPAPRCVLNFTVKIDPSTGELQEAYAHDDRGEVWGSNPKAKSTVTIQELFSPTKLCTANLHGHVPRIGATVDDFEIVDPDKSACGRFDVDPQSTYGLDAAKANCLKGMNGLLVEATEHAINEGISKIRAALGVPPEDDHAGHFFTGDNLEKMERVFRDYMLMEIHLGNAKANDLNGFVR